MFVLSLLRPLRGAWKQEETLKLSRLPRPSDAPQLHASGPDPDRILVVGNGAIIGWGVSSHELAFSGQLAKQLAKITGRGVDVDVVADNELTAGATLRRISDLRLWRYDAIVISLGMSEALRLDSPARWRKTMGALLENVTAEASTTTQIVVFGVPPVGSLGPYGGRLGRISNWLGARYDAVSEELAAADPRITFRTVPMKGSTIRVRETAPKDLYRRLAGNVANEIAPTLEASCARKDQLAQGGAHIRRGLAQDEDARQSALESMGVVDSPFEERFDRIARLAREMFDTEVAAITLIDGERQVFRSVIGFPDVEIPRQYAFCNETIRHESPTVFRDLSLEARFADNPFVHGGPNARFYAGYPIESPDGYRIGALCVIDSRPRPEGPIDLVGLRDLAMIVQREMLDSTRTYATEVRPSLASARPAGRD